MDEKGCRKFINDCNISRDPSSKSAELLAKYSHMILLPSSKASRGLSEEDFEREINSIVRFEEQNC
jgi:hypothetical protein